MLGRLGLLGHDGWDLPRDGWRILYANSEEIGAEDGSADNVLDSRTETFWHTQWDSAKPEPPHTLVIDLGQVETITGIRYVPRQDQTNGHIREFRFFVSSAAFPGLAGHSANR